VCSVRIFAKNIGDPYYEPTIVVHDLKIYTIMLTLYTFAVEKVMATADLLT